MKRLDFRKNHQIITCIIGFFLVMTCSTIMAGFSYDDIKHVQSQPINKVKMIKKQMPKALKKNKPHIINKHYNIKKPAKAIKMTGAKLDKKLKGNLKGLGPVFVKAGKKNQIDPIFLASLAAQETGWGDSIISGPPINNVGGITCMPKKYKEIFGSSYPNPGCTQIVSGGTKWQKFKSIKDSIHFKAAYLKKSYIDRGRETITEIQKKYAPRHAKNDKHGLNKYWIKNIVTIMKDIKKTQKS